MSDNEIKSMSESDIELSKQSQGWKEKSVDIEHRFKTQYLEQQKRIFNFVLRLSFVFFGLFIGSVGYLFCSSSANDSFFAVNKFSLILIGLFALLPSIWVSILVKGLYGIKANNKNVLSDVPIKEMTETIDKAF